MSERRGIVPLVWFNPGGGDSDIASGGSVCVLNRLSAGVIFSKLTGSKWPIVTLSIRGFGRRFDAMITTGPPWEWPNLMRWGESLNWRGFRVGCGLVAAVLTTAEFDR